MASAAITVDGLAKSFGASQAIRDLSFEVRDNEFVTLVGPSGCGKSTCLRIVAGLVSPTSGRVEVRGRPVTGPLRHVGMVFQSPVLLPWRDLLDNVLFTAEMAGESPRAHR